MKALVLNRILETLVDKFNSLRYSKLLYGQKGRYFTNASYLHGHVGLCEYKTK